MKEIVTLLDTTAAQLEMQPDGLLRNRIAAAMIQSLCWDNTNVVRAFVYWQTGEMIAESIATTEKSRLLKTLAQFLETRHD